MDKHLIKNSRNTFFEAELTIRSGMFQLEKISNDIAKLFTLEHMQAIEQYFYEMDKKGGITKIDIAVSDFQITIEVKKWIGKSTYILLDATPYRDGELFAYLDFVSTHRNISLSEIFGNAAVVRDFVLVCWKHFLEQEEFYKTVEIGASRGSIHGLDKVIDALQQKYGTDLLTNAYEKSNIVEFLPNNIKNAFLF